MPARGDFTHKTIAATQRLAVVVGVVHQRPVLEAETDGVVEIQYVGKTDIAVTGRVQLTDMLHAIACLELRPHAGAQAIADHLGHAVITVVFAGWLVEQVTTQLTDVAEGGRLESARIVPELAGAELAANGEARCPDNRRAPTHAKAGGVVQRQGAIQDVVRAHVQRDAAEADGSLGPAAVFHDAGLGQAGGAGGVDIEARVVEEDLRGAGRVVHRALAARSQQVDIPLRHQARRLIGDEPGSISRDGHLIAHRVIGGDQFRADNNGCRTHQVQAVHQSRLGLCGIEHRADAPQLGHRQHVQEQFGAVFDKQRHHVPLADALGL